MTPSGGRRDASEHSFTNNDDAAKNFVQLWTSLEFFVWGRGRSRKRGGSIGSSEEEG